VVRKTDGKNPGMLGVHHELMGLQHLERDLRTQLLQVVEKRDALEQLLKATPAPKAAPHGRTTVRRPGRKPVKAAAKRNAKARAAGAPASVAKILRAHKGTPVSTKELRAQLPSFSGASIHNALSRARKRGEAKSTGAGMWAAA
jgi:hypothetical protein